MKANCDFVDFESVVFYPEPSIAQEDWNSLIDFSAGTADIHISYSVLTGPFPSLIKHSSMKFSQIELIQRISTTHDPGIEGPPLRYKNICSFPLVQLSSARKVWN
jgi:hypothetical protein